MSGIIIDANIARSCADPARHPTSEACLALIQKLAARTCHVSIALTPSLEEEWRKHASRKFTSWWASMESRGRIMMHRDRRVSDYRAAISSVVDDGIRKLLEKDAHIVELAILESYAVASQDDKQKRHLILLSSHYDLIARVQWFNPVSTPGWDDWLDDGLADPVPFRCSSSE